MVIRNPVPIPKGELMWSPKEVEAFVEATEKALRSLRDKIGRGEIIEVKVRRKEIEIICKVKKLGEVKTLIVKLNNRGEVWVEGPRALAMPLKNRVKGLISRGQR